MDLILHRYTTEHVVDYVIVSLFMWGIVDFINKLLSFPREWIALRRPWLPARRHTERRYPRLHGLTAAIHLMTARQRGFPDAAAA